jgi:hypothetical protein
MYDLIINLFFSLDENKFAWLPSTIGSDGDDTYNLEIWIRPLYSTKTYDLLLMMSEMPLNSPENKISFDFRVNLINPFL